MPRPKDSFEALYPCDFYSPEELLEPDAMYTVYEIARLLQGLEPDAEIDAETEGVLLDWAIPWVMYNSADLVVAEPPTDDEPGYYGRKVEGDFDTGTGTETETESGDGGEGDRDADDPSAPR